MLEAAIVGVPGSGKTTLFRLLTGVGAPPRAEAVKGVADVPDPRLAELAALFSPRKVTNAQIGFLDVPGVEPGDHRQARRLFADLREEDALIQVLPAFRAEEDPAGLQEAFELELALADLELVERRLERLARERRRPQVEEEAALLGRLKEALEGGRSVRQVDLTPDERRLLAGFGFLSAKPVVYVWNVAGRVDADDPFLGRAAERRLTVVPMSLAIEREIAELPEEERGPFLADLGVRESGVARLSREVYRELGLISFLTAGADEVRAWPVARGTTAVEAAGKIHSDMARGFIRAEVVAFADLVRAGSFAKAKELGTWRLEGRDYVVQDGDVITFRFHAP